MSNRVFFSIFELSKCPGLFIQNEAHCVAAYTNVCGNVCILHFPTHAVSPHAWLRFACRDSHFRNATLSAELLS